MTTETKIANLSAGAGGWPPDDTEESVLGTDLHQMTIINLRVGIDDAARLYREEGQPLPWRALGQTLLLGCRRPDGTYYRTYPDVFVLPRPFESNRPSASMGVDGPPILIVEVLSDATYDIDLDLAAGKGYSYARAGVPEYLTLDPAGLLAPGGQGWRLVEGRYEPWDLDSNERWSSRQIPIAIGLEGTRAIVFTQDGRRLLRTDETLNTVLRQETQLESQAAQIAELQRQLQGK